jgi:type II secretory pathway pseudopilin PulG
MLKRTLIVVSVVAALLALGFTYVLARLRDQKEINRAQMIMEQLQGQRDSLLERVAMLDSATAVLEDSADGLVQKADSLRDEVRELERGRQQAQLSVRLLRRPEDLKRRFVETFPEIGGSDWGVTEIFSDDGGTPLGIQYVVVPLWFAETFIIDHQNANNYQAQVSRLLQMDSLQLVTIALKDTIIQLEQEKTLAFRTGYDSAYTKYEALNKDYIALLKNPRVSLKVPGLAVILGSAAAGVAVGAAVAK